MSEPGRRYNTRRAQGNNENEEASESGGETGQQVDPSSSTEWSQVGDDERDPQRPNQVAIEPETEQEVDLEGEENTVTSTSSRESSQTRMSETDTNENPTTLNYGGTKLTLVADRNEVSDVVKPNFPKEEWGNMSLDSRGKLFSKMEKQIFEEKLKIVTVTGSGLEALGDVVHIGSHLDLLLQHLEQNDLAFLLNILQYNENDPKNTRFHKIVNILKNLGTVSCRDVANNNKWLREFVDMDQCPYVNYGLTVLMNFTRNNCDDMLNAKIIEEYNQYTAAEQGGNLYLAIALSFLSHATEDECYAIANTLFSLKVTDLPGEVRILFVLSCIRQTAS
jgi:hypothetical protein